VPAQRISNLPAVSDPMNDNAFIAASPRSPGSSKPRATANKFRQLRGANEILEQQDSATRGRKTTPSRI